MPRAKSSDPKRNAGISLTGKQLENLDDYQDRAKLNSRSAVIELLIERYMPALWHDLLLMESKQK